MVAIWYYLRGTPQANLVTYPNTQASGQPASQNPATTYNIAAPSPAPSPNLIYQPPPPLPPTPAYQSFNYSPLNILGLTPQGATMVGPPATPDAPSCCSSGCGCTSCSGGGSYQDGNSSTCLASNPAQQAGNMPPALYKGVLANLISSSVGPNSGQPIAAPAPTPSPVKAAAIIPAQAQGISQGQVGGAPPTNSPPQAFAGNLLTWLQYQTLIAINSGAA